ncbi:gem-associated protein 6-like [Leguminivora glycinivorella]|uniref:gem-associated protein 6-like n=1 Tax=Leguminivora glycinivorella TaxID=1035111 RepID=UPI00200FDD39|nr:gem-associated protein 6-like [Leguminivora glycinivorella]
MNEDQQNSVPNFDSIKDVPEKLLSYVDKFVKVQVIKNRCFMGFLHSIDPISLSVILLVPHEGSYRTTVIPGHAIEDMQEETPSDNIKLPTRKSVTVPTESDTPQRKAQLIAWFKKNLLSITETGDNLTIGNVSVLPPYSAKDICAENPVVFMQIRKLVESMPPNFQA